MLVFVDGDDNIVLIEQVYFLSPPFNSVVTFIGFRQFGVIFDWVRKSLLLQNKTTTVAQVDHKI